MNRLYFPVGLATSSAGRVLYAVNSDFDLQWNGGTIQSYDLTRIRSDALSSMVNPYAADAGFTLAQPTAVPDAAITPGGNPCLGWDVPRTRSDGTDQPPGETCAPPVDSTLYVEDAVIVGALSTDLQLGPLGYATDGTLIRRAFAIVRGDDSVTWFDVLDDAEDPATAAPDRLDAGPVGAYSLRCDAGADHRCDTNHHAGGANDWDNTRAVSLPGEPFAMAISEDGTGIVLTHETSENVSLLRTGFSPANAEVTSAEDAGADASPPDGGDAGADANTSAVGANIGSYEWPPSIEFVAGNFPRNGGDGIATIVHEGTSCMSGGLDTCRPGFLWTSNQAPEVDLVRYYLDANPGETSPAGEVPPVSASLYRPYIVRESGTPVTTNIGGTDERGIVVDPTPRFACLASGTDPAICANVPSRVFIASRAPTSLITGYLGGTSTTGDGLYDPDRLILDGNVPLAAGPSRLYLAPIIDANGRYALRVFIVCYDSSTVFVYDPENQAVENVIHVATGPFAMAFDPFDLHDVATHAVANAFGHPPVSTPSVNATAPTYRFAYVASFTDSYVQVLDLDNSAPPLSTFEATYERIVFTLGEPTPPKGSE